MKIETVETRHCNAGWRNYHFVRIETVNGIVGWSEYDDGFRPAGVTTAIEQFGHLVVGHDVRNHEAIYARLTAAARQSLVGVLPRAIGAIENAVLDAKAKELGVPCHELLGGKIRDRVRVYWSHCGTWRISRPEIYPPTVANLDDVRALGAEVAERGFTALKTNIFRETPNGMVGWSPGFGGPNEPERTPNYNIIKG